MKAAILATIFTFSLALTGALAAEKTPLMKETELAKLAESASTAADHAKVAKHYRIRAEHFEEVAQSKEAEAKKMAVSPRIGMSSKWPSMSRDNVQKVKDAAVQARRAATESWELARLHTQLAVENGLGAQEAAALLPKDSSRSGS